MDAPRPRGVRAGKARRPVPALLRLAWQADRGGVAAIFLASIFEAAATIGATLAIGLLVDAVVKHCGSRGSWPWIYPGILPAILPGVRVAFPFLGPAAGTAEHRRTILVQPLVMAPPLRP